MHLTFLEAANGISLSKQHTKTQFISYPHVKKLTSHEHKISLDGKGLKLIEKLIRDHSAKGHCLLKGELRQPLVNETRAGKSDRQGLNNLIVLDVDGIELPNYIPPKSFKAQDVANLAKTILRELPAAVQDCSFIAQASASLGLKGNKISLHIFMLTKIAVPPKSIKLWLQNCNFNSELFSSQLELSGNGHSLKYTLDTSVADNSKLIFIAPPTFEDEQDNPFSAPSERIVFVSGITDTLDLASLLANVNPEIMHQQSIKEKNRLRKELGFGAKKEKINVSTVNQQIHDVLENPDRMSIQVSDDTNKPYIRCNVNGGDSNAYYFLLNDPTYMFNFKGEPIWMIEKADPEFYKSLFDHYDDDFKENGRANFPVVLRDFRQDVYYNGIYNPNLKQFDEEFSLTPCSASSIEGFMRSHGRTKPDYVADAMVYFNPTERKDKVDLDVIPYRINTFRESRYMMLEPDPKIPVLEMGNSKQIEEITPLIYKIIHHVVGSADLETEYFINWLARIFQTKQKSGVGWVFQGTQGTGKGILYSKILRPLFGRQYVPMKKLDDIEENFNAYMRNAMFLIVDEFHMASASRGTVKIANKLKNQITEETNTIREMRANQIEPDSYTNFIFLTNNLDAVKIEHQDRRYNIAPRQEEPLMVAFPSVVDNIDKIPEELESFARILQSWKVDHRCATRSISNQAKEHMAQVTMSVIEEFFDAIKTGNLKFFLDILDISMTNVMQGQEISTAQRFVKQWIAETKYPFSVIPMEHLRTVYVVLTEDRLPQQEFRKRARRHGLETVRKREYKAYRNNPTRGVVINWALDDNLFDDVTSKYFNDKDKKLLAAS